MSLFNIDSEAENHDLLMSQLADGGHEAFEKLYRQNWLYVYNQAYKRLKNEDDAENITQDVFMSIWENRAKVRINDLKAYLFILTKNKSLNFILRNKPALITEYEDLLVADSSPLKELLIKEALNNLNQKVLSLPLQQRTIFTMRYQNNLSTDEIAEAMGLSVKTVRNHLGKALAALRGILEALIICYMI